MRANPSVSKRPILYGFFFELLSIFLQFQSFLIKSICCLLFIHEKRLRGLRMGFSAFKILKEGLTGNKGWKPHWREPMLKKEYDVIIIGAGGHGLATAYYLAKEHGIVNVAVLEKGWVGSGNIGRNTTIIRSNYMLPGNQPFYEKSMQLWEGLEQDFNYNAMVSQRGILNLSHSDGQHDAYARRGNAMHLTNSGAVLLDRAGVERMCPLLDFDNARFPIKGGIWQPRGGSVRHDAVAWGFARGADSRGVDIIQNCEVTGFQIENGRCIGVETTLGNVKSKKVGMCVAGSSGVLADKAGMRLPIESHVLQAFVSEGLKPIIPGVVTFGAGHFYVSQSDKGGLVFGGDIDGYNSYAQRGNLPVIEDVVEGGMAIMPMIGRARLLRSWGGIMDMSMDGSPFIDKTHIDGLYFNGGWCYGGFKATPASGFCYAHLLATDQSHSLSKQMRLDRFRSGSQFDEKGVGAQPNLH
jgi:sarcosine oxidase subunit beta